MSTDRIQLTTHVGTAVSASIDALAKREGISRAAAARYLLSSGTESVAGRLAALEADLAKARQMIERVQQLLSA